MKIVICMPVFNERYGNEIFIDEIRKNFDRHSVRILIVDDASTDGTYEMLKNKIPNDNEIVLIQNSSNQGHGYSTLKALRRSSQEECEYIISVDGDGQFFAHEMAEALDFAVKNDISVLEGIRVSRNETWYRSIISYISRIFVFVKCYKFPKDANTPLRIYKKNVLLKLLSFIEKDIIVPNLIISALARRSNLKKFEYTLTSRPRLGGDPRSVTFASKFNLFPSKKLILFAIKASTELILFKMPNEQIN